MYVVIPGVYLKVSTKIEIHVVIKYQFRLDESIKTEESKLEDPSKNMEKSTKIKQKKEHNTIPRGKPKSGRVWKSTKSKFTSIIKTRGIKKPFEKKEALRKELQRVKELSRSIKAQKEAEKELKKQRRRENLKRQEENQRKSEIVQVITNPNKLKRMKKKQLRTVEKRDTLAMSQSK